MSKIENKKFENFNRVAYFKEIRNNILKNLGLPENTKPSRVEVLLLTREKILEKQGSSLNETDLS